MRIFIAAFPGSDFIKDFLGLKKSFPPNNFLWVYPDDLHLTFVPPLQTADPKIAYDRLISLNGKPGQSVLLDTLEFGPRPQTPELLWFRGQLNPGLEKLYKLLSLAIGAKSDRRFTPHITLARIPGQTDPALIPFIKNTNGLKYNFRINEVHIVESRSHSSGSEKYDKLYKIPLS